MTSSSWPARARRRIRIHIHMDTRKAHTESGGSVRGERSLHRATLLDDSSRHARSPGGRARFAGGPAPSRAARVCVLTRVRRGLVHRQLVVREHVHQRGLAGIVEAQEQDLGVLLVQPCGTWGGGEGAVVVDGGRLWRARSSGGPERRAPAGSPGAITPGSERCARPGGLLCTAGCPAARRVCAPVTAAPPRRRGTSVVATPQAGSATRQRQPERRSGARQTGCSPRYESAA